jgi:SPP1 family phage portal protein
LIDAYDRGISDLSSEIEQYRLAYIALYGLKSNEEDLDKLRQTGLFEMTRDGKLEFVTKELPVDPVLKTLDKYENNIIRFARSVNFKDENFYGNLSGVAIRYKLMPLEEKAMVSQTKFEKADRHMWRLFEKAIKTVKQTAFFDYRLVKRQFTRNIPVNLLEEARIQSELEGKVSTKKRMSMASFITDPEREAKDFADEFGEGFLSNQSTNTPGVSKMPVKMSDVEAGGTQDRNTNGRVDDL